MKTIVRMALLGFLIAAICTTILAAEPSATPLVDNQPLVGQPMVGQPAAAPAPFSASQSPQPLMPPPPAPAGRVTISSNAGRNLQPPEIDTRVPPPLTTPLVNPPGGPTSYGPPNGGPPSGVSPWGGPSSGGPPSSGPPSGGPPAGVNPYESISGQATMSDSIGVAGPTPFGPAYDFSGDFGRGPGWSDPSYRFSLYYPWHILPNESVLFGMAQGGVTNYGSTYANVGAGVRQYLPNADRILGAWGFFDYDDTQSSSYRRFGVSLETIGKYLDLRANWYFLQDGNSNVVSDGFIGSPFFQGNNISVTRRMVTETPLDGGDLEVGGPLPFVGRYGVRGYVGPYYLHGDGISDTVGVAGRINIAMTDNFQVNVSLQDDSIFHMTTFVNFVWTLPDGVPTKWFKPHTVREQMDGIVYRRDRIPVTDQIAESSVGLLNPSGPPTPGNPPNPRAGQAVFVVHVDPNEPAGTGNGTAESPFSTLEQAREANSTRIDVISIRPRTDGTGTNLMTDGTYSLFNYQKVFGTTVAHNIVTAQGNFSVPATDTGALPLVSNGAITPTTSVFQLASVNEISGLHISGAGLSSHGIGINNAAPIVDFNLNQNQFTDYTTAVKLVNATGDGSSLGLNANQFVNNTMTGTAGISVNGFTLNNNTADTSSINVVGNTATGNSGEGFNVTASGPGTVIDAQFINNTSNANGTGYHFLTQNDGVINLVFNGNTANNNTATSTGVHVEAQSGVENVVSFANNIVTNNTGNGVWFDANQNGGTGGTIFVRNFQGNVISGNGSAAAGATPLFDPDGVLVSAVGPNSFVDARIGVLNGTQNTITNNGLTGTGGAGAGVHVLVDGEGQVIGNIVNNFIGTNASGGIFIDAISGRIGQIGAPPNMAGANPFVIANNTINANGDAGIFARLRNDSVVGLTITGNSIINSVDGPSPFAAGEGIHVRTENTSLLWRLDIGHNFIGIASNGSEGGNASHGIEIETFDQSKLSDNVNYPGVQFVTIHDNQIKFNGFGTANQSDGINFQRNGDSSVGDSVTGNVLIQNNLITNNTGNGINIFASGGNIDVAANPPTGLTLNFLIQGNTIDSNGINGIKLFSTADAPLHVDITSNTITNNGQDGINAETQFFGQITGTWSNNLIAGNGRFGVEFTDADSSGPSFNVTLTGNTIKNNISNGIDYNSFETIPLGGGIDVLNIGLLGTGNGNLIRGNGGDGVHIEPTGEASVTANLINNQILFNGGNGVTFKADEFGVITSTSELNTISNNTGDGWNFTTQAGSDSSAVLGHGLITATLLDNTITFNGAHGINVLNQWAGQINLDVEGSVNPNTTATPSQDTNIIDSNGLNGILVQNAVDLSLSQQAPLNVFQAPNLLGEGNVIRLTVNNTEISGNGTAAVNPDDGDGIYLRVGTSQSGYVVANITDNHFSGNRNIDFVTQSFVATAQPAANVNLFDPTTGNVNPAFQPDPIARLSLHLTGNVGNEIDVTRTGAFYGGTLDTFKTIPGTFNDPSVDGGQYTFGTPDQTRRRNAQRDIVVDTLSTAGHFSEASAASFFVPPITVNNVSPAPPPTTTTFSPTVPFITQDNQYKNALTTVVGFETRIISSTAVVGQVITVAPAFTVPPPAGDRFFIVAHEQAGVGVPTFVTDSGPTVNTFNNFATVLTDFTTEVSFVLPLKPGEFPFPYTWSYSNANGFNGAGTAHGPPQPYPQVGGPGPIPYPFTFQTNGYPGP